MGRKRDRRGNQSSDDCDEVEAQSASKLLDGEGACANGDKDEGVKRGETRCAKVAAKKAARGKFSAESINKLEREDGSSSSHDTSKDIAKPVKAKAKSMGKTAAAAARVASSSSSDESDEEMVSSSEDDDAHNNGDDKKKAAFAFDDSSSSDDDDDDDDDSDESDSDQSSSSSSSESTSDDELASPLPPPSGKSIESESKEVVATSKSVTTKEAPVNATPTQDAAADDDIDSILAQLESAAKGKAKAKSKGKAKAKGKAAPAAAAAVAAVSSAAAANAPAAAAVVTTSGESDVTTDGPSSHQQSSTAQDELEATSVPSADVSPTAAEADGSSAVPMTKSAKARLKKLQKKKEGESAPQPKAAPAAPKTKAAAKHSAAAKLVQERMRLIREAEEKQKAAEDEARRIEEVKEREDEAKRKAAEDEKARRQESKRIKKEKLKAEGKFMTTAQRRQAQKNQAYLKQLQEAGMLPAQPNAPPKVAAVSKKKKKTKEAEKDESHQQHDTEAGHTDIVAGDGEEGASKDGGDTSGAEAEIVSDWEELAAEGDGQNDTAGSGDADREPMDDSPQYRGGKATASKENRGGPAEDRSSAKNKIAERKAAKRQKDEQKLKGERVLRSPICCILGHVDTGKTKLLDKIRRTNVQLGEAGGITQQIGATFFPRDALVAQCLKVDKEISVDVPGLLVIDTPGHESFVNLRARGSSLCDIAILVVDVMHGLEPQTLESIQLLKARKCPFVIAMNKVDRCYRWSPTEWAPFRDTFDKQPEDTQTELERRMEDCILQLQSEGLNCALYWRNPNVRKNFSVIPTSAISGEGIPDLLMNIVSLTQNVMSSAIELEDELSCTVLEVKAIEGLGTTIDVILVSGKLYEGDRIVVCGMGGPLVTTIRALLTPQPLKELRVKGDYIHHKMMTAAMGIKIAAPGLEDAVAGTELFVCGPDDDEEELKDQVMADMAGIFKSVDKSGKGVYVMASTLGSLEALLQYLKDSKVEVFGVNLGTVHKLDVKKAAVMREKGHPENAVILAFDVKVDPDAAKEAKTLGVNVMTADIIYHLTDQFTAYRQELVAQQRREKAGQAVFPCILQIVPDCVFHQKDPIIVGVKILEGSLRLGTPLCVPEKDNLMIGKVTSIEKNKKQSDTAVRGDEVAIRIAGDSNITVGRHFEVANKVVSRLSRQSIDCLKEHFRDDLGKDDWKLVIQLKKLLNIQ